MTAVMLSIRPEWCEKILSGKKTVEVRKTRPKLETPFKVYIYQTKRGWIYKTLPWLAERKAKVVAEFTCYGCNNIFRNSRFLGLEDYEKRACLSADEIRAYAAGEKAVYGWHISDLKIYDNPKKITGFRKPCKNELFCESCAMRNNQPEHCGNAALHLSRPPQSWCYVEVLEE